jgi:tetratricopeptide (TPR) repeat protein
MTSTVSQSKSRILCWYDSGKSDFQAQKYKAAWTFLDKAYSELETTYSELQDRVLHFNNWENLLNLLVVCQCKLEKFDEALSTLNSLIQRIGSELVPETLLNAICKTTEVLISNFCRVVRLDDAAGLATKVIDLKTSNNLSALDTQRILAEIYLRQNNLAEAESRCLEIIAARDSDERAAIDEETDLLLFLIYSQTGNMDEALCKKELLSEPYKSKKHPL